MLYPLNNRSNVRFTHIVRSKGFSFKNYRSAWSDKKPGAVVVTVWNQLLKWEESTGRFVYVIPPSHTPGAPPGLKMMHRHIQEAIAADMKIVGI